MTSVLYIGGTGTISAATVRRSLERGHDVTILNRGMSRRPVPEGVREIVADVRDGEALRAAVAGSDFDVVADFLSFLPEHIERMFDTFEGRTGQYILVSSASAYQKPPLHIPVTERTPLSNPYWQYSRDKIACERALEEARSATGLPFTIVRPSHTYDRQMIPTMGGWTDIARMRAGRPVIVHGDGTTQWTITHADDVAVGITGLMGNPAAIGEDFTVTGDHAPTWNRTYEWLAQAAGVESAPVIHVTSDAIARACPRIGDSLLGDKSHSMVFDNTKLRALVPEFTTTVTFDEGARQILEYFDAHPLAQRVDAELDAAFDRMAAAALAD